MQLPVKKPLEMPAGRLGNPRRQVAAAPSTPADFHRSAASPPVVLWSGQGMKKKDDRFGRPFPFPGKRKPPRRAVRFTYAHIRDVLKLLELALYQEGFR
jgi:hypothetical protein